MSKHWTQDDLKKLRPGQLPVNNAAMPDVSETKKGQLPAIQATGIVRESRMNKTERRFAQELALQAKAGEIAWWAYEPVNLRLGVNCYYRIDFMVMKSDGRLIAYEVKGKWEDDALVKIRTAAEKFPWPFIAVRWVNGAWEYRHF